MKCEVSKTTRRAAFSFLEILMVLAVISTVTAGAVFSISTVTGSEQTKLNRDVAVLNSAIRAYLVSGGTFLQSDLKDPARILAKLKTRASAESAKQLAGLRGSMADERLSFELQSDADAKSGVERARFIADPQNPRFVIERSGPPGIRRFVLDPNLANKDFGTEDRSVAMKLAKSEPWVWDYEPSIPTPRRPASPPVSASVPPATATVSGDPLPLNTPVFSANGATYSLLQFDMPVMLSNPNLLNTSSIMYSINGGEFLYYTGGSIMVKPGSTLAAYSVSTDPDDWSDSVSIANEYKANIVPLNLALNTPQTTLTYASVGGAMVPGNGTALSQTPPPVLTVTNLNQIPVSYQNSDNFKVLWTYDGSLPLTSGTATTGANFSGGFNGDSVPIDLPKWNAATVLQIKAAAKSLNSNALSDSPVVSGLLNVTPMSLRAPDITAPNLTDLVTLAPQSSFGDTPVGYRIKYTLDGSEPSESNGLLYSLPLDIPSALFVHIDIKARVLPPVGYSQWFFASPVTSLRKNSKASTNPAYAWVQDYHNAGLCGYTWNVLGSATNTSGNSIAINGGICVGPLATLDFNQMVYTGDVMKDPLGIVIGPANVVTANITPIRNAAMSLSTSAATLTPTQIFDSIENSTRIDATAADGMNVIRIRRIKLSSSDTLTFHGGPQDFFIVNVTEEVELSGSALIKTSGSIRPDRVILNSPYGTEVKLTGGAGIMSITYLAPRSSVVIGGTSTYTGTLFTGNFSRLHGTPQIVGGSPFGECDNCCN